MPVRRFRTHCSTCGGYGDVCWEQQTRAGTRVLVVYRCSCEAGMVNYSNLAPAPSMAPTGYVDPEGI